MTGLLQPPLRIAPGTANGSDPRPPFRSMVLEEDASSRVERIDRGPGDPDVVRKTHRPRAGLLWRTFLGRSRGHREFANLELLARVGVPCVRPLAWGETRLLGCVAVSHVVTQHVNATNLRDVLVSLPPDAATSGPIRRRLAEGYGALCRALHEAGLVSTTLQPRNVLVCGDLQCPQLRLCDQPEVISWRRSVHLSRRASVDLYDMAFSASRRRDFSCTERLRLLRAYAGSDPEAVRRIWRRLAGRKRWVHRVQRQLARGIFGRLLSPLLRQRPA